MDALVDQGTVRIRIERREWPCSRTSVKLRIECNQHLGGKGFLVPLRSSTYRALLADSTELAEAASGDWIGLLDYNLGKQIYNEIANPGSVSVSIGQVIATTESYKHKESRPQAGWQYKSPVGLPMAFHEKNSHQQ